MNMCRAFCWSSIVLALTLSAHLLVARQAVSPVATALQSLQRSVVQHNMAALQQFVAEFNDLNTADDDGMTLMHYAALEGFFPAAELLLNLGASPNQTDKRGRLPVDYAKFGGHVETQQLLLGIAHPRVNLFTAAALNAQRALARVLAEPDININARTAEGKTALHLSAELGSLYTTQRLIEAGANIFAKDDDGNMPLNLAIDAGHAAIVSLLLEAVNVNEKEHKGWTALNWAILDGKQARVRELLAKGAKVGEGCQNAIEVCLLLEDMEMFDIVRTAGGIDAASSRGDTALMGVSRRGDEAIVDVLLAHHANVNVSDNRHGYTPLRLAGEYNHLSIVKKLIAQGANLDKLDVLGDSAVLRASLRGNKQIVQTLLDAGADPNITGAGGMTPLMWAVFWNEKETAQALLAGGADASILNSSGVSALEWAAQRGDAEMVQLVLDSLDTSTHTARAQVHLALTRQAIPHNNEEVQAVLRAQLNDGAEMERSFADNNEMRELVKGFIIAIQEDDDITFDERLAVAEQHADFPLQWIITHKPDMLEDILKPPFYHNLNKGDKNIPTPVMLALLSESPALEILLSHGADPNLASGGFPAVVRAATFGNKEAVKTLIAWRANLDAVDQEGFTALMHASQRGYFELTELLLLEGANPNLVNKEGEDALALAEKSEHQDIVEILRIAKGVEE